MWSVKWLMWEEVARGVRVLVYTSRYSNPELKSGNYTAVRISVGAPRWKVGYDISGVIKDLMPIGLRTIENVDEFCRLYYERLDAIGVDRIREQLNYYESFGKPVVLKSLSKPPIRIFDSLIFSPYSV